MPAWTTLVGPAVVVALCVGGLVGVMILARRR